MPELVLEHTARQPPANEVVPKLIALLDRSARARGELGLQDLRPLGHARRFWAFEHATSKLCHFDLAFALDVQAQAASNIPLFWPRSETQSDWGGLTRRERQVAALVAQGKSNRDIATELVLSERTIENHVGNILSKLEFNSRTQIAAWVVEKELLETNTR